MRTVFINSLAFAGNGIVSLARSLLSVGGFVIDVVTICINEIVYLVTVRVLVIRVTYREPYAVFRVIGYSRRFFAVRSFVIDRISVAVNAIIYIVSVLVSHIHISVCRDHNLLESYVMILEIFLFDIVGDLVSAAVKTIG